jgi:hypothetical protein
VVALLLVLVLPPLTEPRATMVHTVAQYVPANTFPLTARPAAGGGVLLEWPSQDAGGAHVGYTVFRATEDWLQCQPVERAASVCMFLSPETFPLTEFAGSTGSTSFRDRPPPGRWVYRVAARAGPNGEAADGDFLVLSEVLPVDVG